MGFVLCCFRFKLFSARLQSYEERTKIKFVVLKNDKLFGGKKMVSLAKSLGSQVTSSHRGTRTGSKTWGNRSRCWLCIFRLIFIFSHSLVRLNYLVKVRKRVNTVFQTGHKQWLSGTKPSKQTSLRCQNSWYESHKSFTNLGSPSKYNSLLDPPRLALAEKVLHHLPHSHFHR